MVDQVTYVLPCGHGGCNACYDQHISTRVKLFDTSISCMECETRMPVDVVAIFCKDPKLKALYGRSSLNSYVESVAKLRWCPARKPTLSHAVYLVTSRTLMGVPPPPTPSDQR